MTRGEAIAYLIDRADELEQRRAAMIPRAQWRQECAEFAEAKAALAESVPQPYVRCQYQDSDLEQCPRDAVLCETHGGHDACAAEIMRLQGLIADHGGCVWRDPDWEGACGKHHKNLCREHINRCIAVNRKNAAAEARGEIARALEAVIVISQDIGPLWGAGWSAAMKAASRRIRDGSIREWLPEEGLDAK